MHDVRVRCVRLRGLIRLVRPVFGDYREENAAFRDISQLLSGMRDATVMQDTYDKLIEYKDDQLDRRALSQIRRHFTLESKGAPETTDVTKLLGKCRKRLADARSRASGWQLDEDGWAAISGGLSRTYARAVKASQEAHELPGTELLHEMRRQLKYHWFHTLLLRRIWPDEMNVRAALARQLSGLLGDQHDLAVFTGRITADPESFNTDRGVEMALVLAHRRRIMLEEKTWPLAGRLFAETPEALSDHWHTLWKAWRKKDG